MARKVMYIDPALVLSQALLEDKQSSTGGYSYTLTHKGGYAHFNMHIFHL